MLDEAIMAVSELERVGHKHKFIKANGYRTEGERIALEKWNVVAKTILHCEKRINIFEEVGYTGYYYWFTP